MEGKIFLVGSHDELPLDFVEGLIAHTIYGKEPGDSVFRRVSPVSANLTWAEYVIRHQASWCCVTLTWCSS